MKYEKKYAIGGRSFVLNSLFILLNVIGLAFVVAGSLPFFKDYFLLFNFIGFVVIAISSAALFILHGRLMMSYLSRILVGSILVVSGLIKINDPVGFAYKLEEYFQDGALAYRLKGIFGASFSLEALIQMSLFFAISLAIVELVLGVLLIIGARLKWVLGFLVPLMLFFTFLTWHTSSCNPEAKFMDRNTYELSSEHAQSLLVQSKTNKGLKVISKSNGKLVIDEFSNVNCVADCGCFGDTFKNTIGRSLTPKESFLKDLVLLYFIFWIFLALKFTQPNTARQNLRFVIGALLIIGAFALLFKWPFLIYFSVVLFVCSLWIKRDGGYFLGNFIGSTGIVAILGFLIAFYVLRFDSIKDFRPYAVGNNLRWKTLNGVDGKFETVLTYKNKYSGKIIEYKSPSREYRESKVWENSAWTFVEMKQKTIRAPKLASITEQFNPTISIKDLGPEERQLEYVNETMLQAKKHVYDLMDLKSMQVFSVDEEDYNRADFPDSLFKLTHERFVADDQLEEISIRDLILKGRKVFVLSIKSVKEVNLDNLDRIKAIYGACKKQDVPFVMITSSSRSAINKFRNDNNFHVPCFTNDETELKVISRVNPVLMVVQKGVVSDKFPNRSIPKLETIKKKYL